LFSIGGSTPHRSALTFFEISDAEPEVDRLFPLTIPHTPGG